MKHWRQLNKIKTKQTRLNLLNSSIFNRQNNTMLQNTHTHWRARTCKWDLVGEKQTQHTHYDSKTHTQTWNFQNRCATTKYLTFLHSRCIFVNFSNHLFFVNWRLRQKPTTFSAKCISPCFDVASTENETSAAHFSSPQEGIREYV